MDDYISREETVKAFCEKCRGYYDGHCVHRGECDVDVIQNAPSCVPQWISVKDRLPELSKEVLFCHKERIYYIYELGRCWKDSDGNIQIELDNEDCYMSLSYLVSKGYFWTELPEPPKENNYVDDKC